MDNLGEKVFKFIKWSLITVFVVSVLIGLVVTGLFIRVGGDLGEPQKTSYIQIEENDNNIIFW